VPTGVDVRLVDYEDVVDTTAVRRLGVGELTKICKLDLASDVVRAGWFAR
jgi:hypothetical protein